MSNTQLKAILWRPLLVCISFAASLLWFCQTASAQFGQRHSSRATAMFKNRHPSAIGTYRDQRAKKRGDLLTVMVNVGTTINNLDQRQMKKTTNADASLDTGGTGLQGVNLNYNTEADRQFRGDSTFREARNLTDRFTVAVIDVNPRNGNLLIQGRRKIVVQGDIRTLVLSGMVRGRDVRSNNSISSESVHDLKLFYEGTGNEQNFTRQGWLMKKFSRAWPF